jgi:hypothetical protein
MRPGNSVTYAPDRTQPQLPPSSRLDSAHVPLSAHAAASCVAGGHLIPRMSRTGAILDSNASAEFN